MNSLIKYGLYFVVAFSVLAFGAAEVWAFSIVEFVVFLLVFLFIESRLFSRRTPQITKGRKQEKNGNERPETTILSVEL